MSPHVKPSHSTRPRWLVRRRECPDAAVDLYVFAHAGGSPGEYLMWSDDLDDLQLWGIGLPGRASRRGESAYDRLTPLVDDLVARTAFGRPFVFFGHSFGALLAYETARALRRCDRDLPDHMILSSCRPPHLLGTDSPRVAWAELTDDELLSAVEGRFGRLAPQVHADERLRAVAMEPLRADMTILDTYTYRPEPPLRIPATVLYGTEEEEDGRLDPDGWADHVERIDARHALPGGHFHFRSDAAPVLQIIRDTARSLAPADQKQVTP
ncbi:thioesterase II family protein [Streptomyces parvus]|uniref:thioesterase II family protein n=1 Tax=Streptomyces parvus TaxID=66428 RepID=UPI00370FCA5F